MIPVKNLPTAKEKCNPSRQLYKFPRADFFLQFVGKGFRFVYFLLENALKINDFRAFPSLRPNFSQ